jgi:mannose-6-phosphate isomerase-like protein (cupin superfamily)
VTGDEMVEPITAALLGSGGFYGLWGSDAPVQVPQDGSAPATQGWFPPPGGFRFGVVVFGPEQAPPPDLDMEAAIAELARNVPGLVETLDPANPILHTSDTVDFNFVVSGEIWLETDDGRETLLKAGDCVIQNGVRHGWHNRSSEPCVLAVALIGASRNASAVAGADGSGRAEAVSTG